MLLLRRLRLSAQVQRSPYLFLRVQIFLKLLPSTLYLLNLLTCLATSGGRLRPPRGRTITCIYNTWYIHVHMYTSKNHGTRHTYM
jgi:hypothetical protein